MKKQSELTDAGTGASVVGLKEKRDKISRGNGLSTSSSIPWQQRPAGSDDVVWRHTGNPIIDRNYVSGAQGIYNSAVIPFGDGFAGVFRYEKKCRYPRLHSGWSDDGLTWHIETEPIVFAGDPAVVGTDDYALPIITITASINL